MKNQTILKKGIGLLLLSVSLTGCEDLIEIDLPNNQMNTEDVFSDIHTINAARSNLYTNFRDVPLFSGGYSGDSGRFTDELESFYQEDFFYTNSITASDSSINQLWSTSYSNLYHINTFLEGIEKTAVLSEKDKVLFVGEAHLLRGMYYHYLTQYFGDIPYVISTDYKTNSKLAKTPYMEVLSLVEQDLKIALDLLDVDYTHPDRIYPNKAVTELLLAKNYLLQKRYDLAEVYAQKLLDNPLYTLETDLNKVFKKTATSTLWQKGPYDVNSEYSNTIETALYIFTSLPPTRVALSTTQMQAFEPNDLRLQLWTKTLTDGVKSYSHAYKYQGLVDAPIEYSIMYRLEEAYFIKAEALVYQEKVGDAVGVLNEIRTRRGLTALPTTLNKEDFITELLAEYQREFFTEGGHRFLDLKRNNRLQTLESVKPNWKSKHALLPIPESEILMNDNLKPQNDGY